MLSRRKLLSLSLLLALPFDIRNNLECRLRNWLCKLSVTHKFSSAVLLVDTDLETKVVCIYCYKNKTLLQEKYNIKYTDKNKNVIDILRKLCVEFNFNNKVPNMCHVLHPIKTVNIREKWVIYPVHHFFS